MNPRVKNMLCTATLFMLLLLPICYALFTAIDLEYSWLKRFAYLAVVIVLLLVPASFLKARTYFLIEGFLNFFFFPIDIASLYLNRQPTSTAFLQNIINTDSHEALEVIISVWPFCILVIILWVTYFFLASRIENRYLFPSIARKIIIVSIPVFIVTGMILMVIFLKQVHEERSVKDSISDAAGLVWMKLYKIYPYNLYLETADIIQTMLQQHQLQKQVASFRFGIQQHHMDKEALYVLVIGEASRYDHWSLNGYPRPTTPQLEQTTNIVSYDNAYAQANLTSYSVPLIITRATSLDPQTAYKEKALTEAFQEAGYRAGLITKQIPSTLISRIMSACDYSFFNAKGIDVDDNYDEEMVMKIAELNNDSLQFFILHSLGCHFRYELRYPKEMTTFQPVLGNAFSYSMISEENKDKLINAYDNAILYTDYFLSTLIQYMDSLNRPAVMLYLSDHGESFWDDDRKLSLHGSYQISEYEYHVPLVVWYSDEYAEAYPDKVKALQQNKNTPVSSDVVFYSMLDLAGINDIVDSTRSICSPYLEPEDTIWVTTGSGSVERWVLPR